MAERWFYDQEYEEHVLMERAPDGIWRELLRVETRLSVMLKGGDHRMSRVRALTEDRRVVLERISDGA